MSVQVYTIWHRKLYDELYAHIDPQELKNIVMFGVNEDYEKTYTENRYNVMFEYDLPIYNPLLQKHGYCQTTCMWHLYKNPYETYKGDTPLDYIGFIQYDMTPDSNMLQHIRNKIADAESKGQEVIFHEQTEHILQSIRWASGLVTPYEGSALQHYNAYFGTSYTINDFLHNPRLQVSPILHTFVIPVKMFEKMMGWLDSYLNMLESMYPTYMSNRSQSELLERCHGMFLALECVRDNVVFEPMKIKHIWPLYHDKTEFKNYKTIC